MFYREFVKLPFRLNSKLDREGRTFLFLHFFPAIYIFRIFLEDWNEIFEKLTTSGQSDMLFYDTFPVSLDFTLIFFSRCHEVFDHSYMWISIEDLFLQFTFSIVCDA